MDITRLGKPAIDTLYVRLRDKQRDRFPCSIHAVFNRVTLEAHRRFVLQRQRYVRPSIEVGSTEVHGG